MGGVARQEDAALAEPVGQRSTRPEVGGPSHLGDVVRVEVGAGGDQSAYALRGGVRLALLELRRQLEVRRAGQRAEGDETRVAHQDMPVEPVESVLGDPHIGDQHRRRVHGLTGHRDFECAPDRAPTAVRRDQVGGAHRTGGQVRRDAFRVLGESGQRGREGDIAAQLAQACQQDLLCAPLRHHPRLPVRLGLSRRRPAEHVALALAPPVLPDHADRCRAAVRTHGVAHSEIVEDLSRARLDALAARAGEERGRLLDEEGAHAAAGQIAGEREAAGAGADDQHLSFLNAVKFHGRECVLNAVKLSRWVRRRSTGHGWPTPRCGC